MRKKLDRIIVIDVESTCWEDKTVAIKNVSEIIQIGVAALDVNTLTVVQQSNFMVKSKYSKVSPFCTRLTGLTQEDVDKGADFAEVIEALSSDYEIKDRPWASYGDYDRNQFHRNCHNHEIEYPFGDRHINIKTLVAAAMKWPSEEAMDVALKFIGLPLMGRHHDALDDATNAASILAFVLHGVRE